MSSWLQHSLVIAAAITCLGIIARQGCRTFTFRGRGKLGACCAKGCDAEATLSAKPRSARVQFVPLEDLARKR